MERPQWIKKYLKDKDYLSVEEAIKNAELKTSGEVVPIIVRSSIHTGHVPLLILLFLSLLYLFFDLYHYQIDELELNVGLVWASNLILVLLATYGLSKILWLNKYLTTKEDIISQVHQRAFIEFYNQRVHKTAESTGILIFLSLQEKQAIVLGDKAIAQKITQEDWQDVVDLLIKGIKNKELAKGLCQAIKKSGELLETHFPISANDQNELPNQLIIKE